MENLKRLVKELSAINGASGDEGKVREKIISLLPADVKYKVDNLGNLIVEKKGKSTPAKKLMVAAHMDEVGFIVSHIDDDGSLCFAPIGGVLPCVVFGRQLVIKDNIYGAVAGKPIHILEGDEKTAQPKISDLRIDIGAGREEDLDVRAGCAIMLQMLNGELPYDVTFVFTVQEEIGTRGAAAAAYSVNPDIAIVLETTTACDISGVEGEKKVCVLGNGAVVSFMDRSTLYDRELFRLGFDTAREIGVKCQTKTVVAGGNDSGAIHKSVGGVRTMAISVPCRYLHSPNCVIKETDLYDTAKLANAMIGRLGELN